MLCSYTSRDTVHGHNDRGTKITYILGEQIMNLPKHVLDMLYQFS